MATIPSLVPTGVPSDCVGWYQTTVNDSCDDIAGMFGTFSRKDFILWNPSVYSDCSNIQVCLANPARLLTSMLMPKLSQEGSYYCIAVGKTPKIRTAPLKSVVALEITPPPEAPTAIVPRNVMASPVPTKH